MLRKDFIICKTRNLLNEFMTPIITDADKPRQKFLRQAVAAILLSGSLIVTEFAGWIHDDCTDIFHRLKRLLNHLVSRESSREDRRRINLTLTAQGQAILEKARDGAQVRLAEILLRLNPEESKTVLRGMQ